MAAVCPLCFPFASLPPPPLPPLCLPFPYLTYVAFASPRQMVKQLHAAGVEVLLDVVYNHTAEADDKDPYLISFRWGGCVGCGQERRGEGQRGEGQTEGPAPSVGVFFLLQGVEVQDGQGDE